MLRRQRERTKRNWNLARGKIGSSMRVWGAVRSIRKKSVDAKNRVMSNVSKLHKAGLALTVLKAVKLHRKRTKTTDEDVRKRYVLCHFRLRLLAKSKQMGLCSNNNEEMTWICRRCKQFTSFPLSYRMPTPLAVHHVFRQKGVCVCVCVYGFVL